MFATIWNTLFFNPLLNLLILFYDLFGNSLGLAILGIAVIGRVVMIPLVKKQTNMTKKMSSLKPELDKLQKKYANNKEKLSQEQIKLYKKVGYNPLGCIGTFIPQLIILSALIGVIRKVTESGLDGLTLYQWVENLTGLSQATIITKDFLFWDLTKSYSDVSNGTSKFAVEALPYLGLSVLVGIIQYFTTLFTQKMQDVNKPKEVSKEKKKSEKEPLESMQAGMQKSTMLLLPLMTMIFTLRYPAALGWYWMLQSLLLVVQYITFDFNKTKKGVQNLLDVLHKKK